MSLWVFKKKIELTLSRCCDECDNMTQRTPIPRQQNPWCSTCSWGRSSRGEWIPSPLSWCTSRLWRFPTELQSKCIDKFMVAMKYHEDWLQLLQLEGEDGLVVVGDSAVHWHNHAVGHNGDDYQPLKRRPSHEPDKQTPETIKKSIKFGK